MAARSRTRSPLVVPVWTGEATAFVAAARAGRLATIRHDGSPHIVPLCFCFDGAAFFSVIDRKPKRVEPEELQRVRNILERPQVTLLVDRYSEDWSRLGFVMVYGQARLLRDGKLRDRAIELLREKYSQYREMDLEGRPVIQMVPQRVVSWGNLSP